MSERTVEGGLLGLRVLLAALAHPVVLGDQVDEDAEERHQDHEHHPGGLVHAADVVAAEDVDEDVIAIQIHAIHAKNRIIVQRMSRNG